MNFRDALRLDREAALRYESFKKNLDPPRNKYSEAKGQIIAELQKGFKPYYHPRSKAKTLAVLGHAKSGQNTHNFIERLFVNNDLEIIDLETLEISSYEYKRSSKEDDFISIVKKIIDADRVIFATPAYWYAMSGVMKNIN